MASFGSFETEREVYSGPLYTVYSARKAGDPQAEYAIKVFSVQRIDVELETRAELEPLLSDIERTRLGSIEVQKKGAAASPYIAPVMESGQDERGVWYATRFYARSVNKIITGRVALGRDALHHILRSVARGALDLKRTCGRSHGDIQPSNIQISRSEKLNQAEVLLSDPMPGGADEAVRYELSDLRVIGQILLQLVRQRAIGDEADFLILPILPSPEWTRLFGKEVDQWLSLCNRLLDPHLSLDQFTLEQLVARLDELAPKPSIMPKVLVAVAAVLVLGLVGFVLWRVMNRPVQVQIIEITSDPPGATILVDGRELPTRTGSESLKVELEAGNHVIEARHTTLQQSTNVVATAGATLPLHFRFRYGSVAIRSFPGGATILRDGSAVGTTPSDGTLIVLSNLPADAEITFQLTHEGYIPGEPVKIVIKDGEEQTLRETLVKTDDSATVEIATAPPSAKVLWQGKQVIEKTPGRIRLPLGPQQVTLVYQDWPPQEMILEVTKGSEISTNFGFPMGYVSLDSDPPGSTVWVGTNRLGTTPMASVLRPAGPNTFRFELSGFETTNETVNLANRQTVSLKPALLTSNGVFRLLSDPPVAMILDSSGRELGRTASGQPVTVSTNPGTHQFTARIEGLGDVTATLSVEKRKVASHTFQFDYGTVWLDSTPQGATISVDGRSLGVTPKSFIQKPGVRVTYVLTAPDYLASSNEVTLRSRETLRSPAVRLLPELVSVAFTSDPPGAQFYSGTSVITDSRLPWGTNVVTAKHALFPWLEAVEQQVVVKKGAANSNRFEFVYGSVAFETEPSEVEAGIFERGRLIGRTPTTLYVRPGPVNYEVVYEDQTNRVGTNVLRNLLHKFKSVFEVKRDYTNSIGMVLVRVKDGYYVGKFEVMEKEYRQVLGGTLQGKPQQPAVDVSWADALKFCSTLSESDRDSMNRLKLTGWNYSLPTEAEWKSFAEPTAAVLDGSVFSQFGVQQPAEIDPNRKSAGSLGIYDLFGNAAEWCLGTDNQPITMGGSVVNRKPPPEAAVARLRYVINPPDASPTIGFRCVLKPPSR